MAKKSTQNSLFPSQAVVMPEGYYSGDKPNLNLRAFVEAHLRERPYNPETDGYNVAAFTQAIKTTKATAIYNMHTYWSKKPHDAIRQYIRHYTQPGDAVLDPFCGSGGTALAALMEGRKAIAIDRSPAATFITKNYCTPVDPDALQTAFEELRCKVLQEMEWLYETRCDRCDGKATTAYTVYSQVFQCSRCLKKVPLFDCVEVESQTAKGKPKKANACPYCFSKGHTEVIRSQSKKFGYIPVRVRYVCQNGCKPTRDERRHNDPNPVKKEYFDKYDLTKLAAIEAGIIPYWYPRGYDMTGFSRYQRDALHYYGVTEVADLFTKRNLWALATIRDAIDKVGQEHRDALLFGLTSVILSCSRMYREREEGRGAARGGYYMPQLARDMVVTNGFYYKVEKQLIPAFRTIHLPARDFIVSCQSACDLTSIPPNSLDYVFTDPAYSDTVQYGELNFVWEAWLGSDTHWHDEEIVVNEVRGKGVADWAAMMRQAMAECYRVLKPGRWLSLCYHDTSEGTWELVQDIMAEVGFVVDKSDSALFIDTEQKSYNQLTADKVTKRDLVINFRKPRPGEWRVSQVFIPADADVPTFRELARQVIREYLVAHPGATKDRIYDELVSRMVRAGQMQAHNFEEVLREVAEEVQQPRRKSLFETETPDLFGTHVVSRWYVKETAESAVDEAESALEDAAAQKLGRLIKERLEEDPTREGVHYSDLFEQYVYSVHDRPRRQLIDWLPDYFFKTLGGTWRLPATPEEEEAKASGRRAGTNRRVRRFLALLDAGDDVPERLRPSPSDLAEWIRHCQRSAMYDEGRRLYEQGQGDWLSRLPEEVVAGVEEDYQICLRAIQRAAAPAGKQRSRKAGRKAKGQN
jgi:DNA modification methylase